MNPHPRPTPTSAPPTTPPLLATGADAGFWDEHGRPAPWPDDIERWTPDTAAPITPDPGHPPF